MKGQQECHCQDRTITHQGNINQRKGFSITKEHLETIKDDIALGIPVDYTEIKKEKERKKNEMRDRIEEFRQLDYRFGHANKETSHALSLADDVELAKRRFYGQRAKLLQLRGCEDFQDMNSFIYKAKSQAIRDRQIQQIAVMKKDASELLEKEIKQRYKTIEEDYERERREREALAKLNETHLHSLKAMIKEKEITEELKRLKYQQAAMIRNDHTAYRLKKRLNELKEQEEENKNLRALQQGVFENKQQILAIMDTESKAIDEREKAFFKRKAEILKKINDEKDEIQRKKNEQINKILEEARLRQVGQEQNLELAYIRDKDLADKKWRMEMEEKERKRLAYKQQLWEEQEKTKEDILDHICQETEKDRLDFERIVRENEEDFHREQKVEMEKRMKVEAARKELQCTINEKIDLAREEKERKLENARNQIINQRLHDKYHEREMIRELNRLRKEGLEEKYISETLRHCNISPDQKDIQETLI